MKSSIARVSARRSPSRLENAAAHPDWKQSSTVAPYIVLVVVSTADINSLVSRNVSTDYSAFVSSCFLLAEIETCTSKGGVDRVFECTTNVCSAGYSI